MSAERTAVDVAAALATLSSFDTIIDVRSEGEFAEDHLPGAINCPVLHDAERAEVGTMDRQQSSFEARRRGAALVSRNIANHLERQFATMPKSWRPLIYCWRGGNRSESMTHVLTRVGWQARQLAGGYRAYRRQVVNDLQTLPLHFELRVICGATGTGKSRLLQHLRDVGAQVLDLEAHARHRGSVLGSLPAAPQPTQKSFETALWNDLRYLDPGRPVFVESESRKIGELRVPDALLQRMRAASCVRVELPLAARVRLLREEYVHFEDDIDVLQQQLDCLTDLHGRSTVSEWKALARQHRWDAFVERLLVEHYDPAYQRSIERNFSQASQAPVMELPDDSVDAYRAAARQLAAG